LLRNGIDQYSLLKNLAAVPRIVAPEISVDLSDGILLFEIPEDHWSPVTKWKITKD